MQNALSYSLAAPAIWDIQSSDWARWYAPHKRPRRNVVRYEGSGRDDGVVADGHAGKYCNRTTDPDVGTKTNWRNPGWTRRLCGMVVRVENRCQVPDQAIVTDNDTVIGHANRISVDKDTLAEHKGAILAAPTSIGIVLERRNKRPHVIDPSRVPPLQSPRINCDAVATAVPSNLPGLAKGFTIYAPA